jgi:hypothetical protein
MFSTIGLPLLSCFLFSGDFPQKDSKKITIQKPPKSIKLLRGHLLPPSGTLFSQIPPEG